MVEEGKPAPEFELTSDAGETVKLSELRGKPVVLYFYPKDDTPGFIRSNSTRLSAARAALFLSCRQSHRSTLPPSGSCPYS